MEINQWREKDCKLIRLRENDLEIDFKVYPNPASNYIQFKLDAKYTEIYKNVKLSIYDIKGAFIQEKNIDFNSNIAISNLQNGVYLYTLQDENQILKSGQLIKK